MPKLPNISIDDLKRKNDEAKAARAQEKSGSASTSQQQKRR